MFRYIVTLGGYCGLLMGYSVLGVTKLINPVMKLFSSLFSFLIMQDKKKYQAAM